MCDNMYKYVNYVLEYKEYEVDSNCSKALYAMLQTGLITYSKTYLSTESTKIYMSESNSFLNTLSTQV